MFGGGRLLAGGCCGVDVAAAALSFERQDDLRACVCVRVGFSFGRYEQCAQFW